LERCCATWHARNKKERLSAHLFHPAGNTGIDPELFAPISRVL
jgi:hypothetical protein